MSRWVLDTLDCRLQLYRDSERLWSAPGLAYWDGTDYRYGEPARAVLRQHPRQVVSRYWQALDTQERSTMPGNARHHADLVYSQLQQLASAVDLPDSLTLAIPGTLNRDQLALLLGVIEHCTFSVDAVIHRSALLACANSAATYHLELQWHQAVLIPLSYSDGNVSAGTENSLPRVGLMAFYEAMLRAAANSFVDQTRFDPLRSATAEQAVFDALGDTLTTLLTEPEMTLTVEGHRARIKRSVLTQACAPLYQQINDALGDGEHRLLIEDGSTLLPGLAEQLPHVHPSAPQALAAAALSLPQPSSLKENDLTFQRTLPCETPAAAAVPKPASTARPAPTHALQGHQAWPLDQFAQRQQTPWTIEKQGGNWTLTGSSLPQCNNNSASAGTVLRPGDTLRWGNGELLTLITVAPHG